MNQKDLARIGLMAALCLSVGLGAFFVGRARHRAPTEIALPAATPQPPLKSTIAPSPRPIPTIAVAPLPDADPVEAALGELKPAQMMAHVQYLSQTIGPRLTGTAKEKEAARYIEAQFVKFGYQPQRQFFTTKRTGTQSSNVFATKTSTAPNARQIVIGAHYDSVRVAPGANDNASGVAVMLELARVLADKNPPFEVVFVAFGSEENGHDGSLHYAKLIKRKEVPIPDGMVNMDMVGVGAVYAIGRWKNPNLWLMNHCAAADKRVDGQAKIGSTFGGKSDYASFSDVGVPVAGFAWDDDPNYHSKGDSWKNVNNPNFSSRLRQTARTLLAACLTPEGGFTEVSSAEPPRQPGSGR